MCGSLLLTAMMAMGIDAGWRPLPGGGMEYILQIEPNVWDPNTLGSLGQSSVPEDVRDIRQLTITVGREVLPRTNPPILPQGSHAPPNPTKFHDAGFQDSDPFVPGQSSTYPPPGNVPGTYNANRGMGTDDPASEKPWMPDANRLAPPPTGLPESLPSVFDEQPPSEEGPLTSNLKTKTDDVVEEINQLMPLTLTIAALVAALGGMLYLGIIAWDYRRRYRDLLRQLIERAGDGNLEIESPV